MGLIYSTLISCVGVLELVAFYFHLRRQLTPPVDGNSEDLGDITDGFKQQLAKKHTLTLRCEIDANKDDKNFALATATETILEPSTSTQSGANQKPLSVDNVQHETEEEQSNKSIGRIQEFILDIATNLQSQRKDDEVSPYVERVYLGEELPVDPVHGRREASPFPTYERLAPRGSICELAENPSINVTEVDEEEVEKDHNTASFWSNSLSTRSRSSSRSPNRSRSSSPRTKRSIEVDDHRSKQYPRHNNFDDSRKKHRSVSPEPRSKKVFSSRRRSRSFTDLSMAVMLRSTENLQIVDRDYWSRSPSPFKEIFDEDLSNKFRLVFDDDFKNSLDGVKQKEEKKRDFKRRREMKNKEDKSVKMLEYNKDVVSEPGGSKDTKEAFWVK